MKTQSAEQIVSGSESGSARDSVSLEKLSERLNSLERDNRVLRWVAAGLFVAATALVGQSGFFSSAKKEKNPVVEAQRIVVKDHQGIVRASFGIADDGAPALKFFNDRGVEVAAFDTYADASASLSMNHKESRRVTLGTRADGSAMLQFLAPDPLHTASLFSWADGTSGVFMNHDRESVMMGVKASGEAGVLVNDQAGSRKMRLGNESIDPTSLGLMGPTSGSMASDVERDQPEVPQPRKSALVGPPIEALAPAAGLFRSAM